jgi:hypothetical protein
MSLTRTEINHRYYENHKKEEKKRNKKYYKTYYPKVQIDRRRNYRNRMHRVDESWVSAKLEEQKNCCAICFKPFEKTPHIDHDHRCLHSRGSCDKCRRGLLCEDCNLGLGRFEDNIEVMKNAIQYLERYNESPAS